MKRRRRYRETNPDGGICSVHDEGRIHDFFKGWGTVCKDGSILWDTWRPLTKRQSAKASRNMEKFRKKPIMLMGIINQTFPNLTASDIINVQPMR